ncbi:hypothetical protein UT300012_23690 [Paraclostridium bifermentans]
MELIIDVVTTVSFIVMLSELTTDFVKQIVNKIAVRIVRD